MGDRTQLGFEEWAALRAVPRGLVLDRVTAPSCDGGVGLDIALALCLSRTIDERGVPADAVWHVCRPGVPDQWVRLHRGSHSLQTLLERGTILDGGSCPYGARPAAAALANLRALSPGAAGPAAAAAGSRGGPPAADPRAPTVHFAADRPGLHRQLTRRAGSGVPSWVDATARGVPQPTPQSGVCWWGALSFVLCTSPALQRLMRQYLPPDLATLLPQVATHPDASERLRAALFERYAVGHDPRQDPRLDGGNGFNELLRLGVKLGLPFCCRVWAGPGAEPRPPAAGLPAGCAPEQAELLGLRVPRVRADRPPLRLRLGGSWWKLRGALQGSRLCGHQTSVAELEADSACRWAIHDTDWCSHGVAPLQHEGPRGAGADALFWDALRHLVLISNQGGRSRVCHVNGGNHDTRATMLEAAVRAGAAPAGAAAAGPLDVEVECLYTRDGGAA